MKMSVGDQSPGPHRVAHPLHPIGMNAAGQIHKCPHRCGHADPVDHGDIRLVEADAAVDDSKMHGPAMRPAGGHDVHRFETEAGKLPECSGGMEGHHRIRCVETRGHRQLVIGRGRTDDPQDARRKWLQNALRHSVPNRRTGEPCDQQLLPRNHAVLSCCNTAPRRLIDHDNRQPPGGPHHHGHPAQFPIPQLARFWLRQQPKSSQQGSWGS